MKKYNCLTASSMGARITHLLVKIDNVLDIVQSALFCGKQAWLELEMETARTLHT